MSEWNEISKEEFAEFVMNMRVAAGLSQQEFAEKMGVSEGSIRHYEDPTKKRMPKDVYVFEVKVREICLPIIRAKRGITDV